MVKRIQFDLNSLPSSREEAVEKGEKYYYNGVPCTRGHLYARRVNKNRCVACDRLRTKDERTRRRKEKQNSILIPEEYKDYKRSSKEAEEAGHTFYFTGLPCINGHRVPRFVGTNHCPECGKEKRERIKDEFRDYHKEWRANNKDKCADYQRKHRFKKYREKYVVGAAKMGSIKTHIAKMNKKEAGRQRERRKTDKNFKAVCFIRRCVRDSLRRIGTKKEKSSSNYVHYTTEQLVQRIEMNLLEGMTWGNHGSVWEIDHTKPIARFIEQGVTDPAIINSLCNLKPLWKSHNKKKWRSFG